MACWDLNTGESKAKGPEASRLSRRAKSENAGSHKDPVSVHKMENEKNGGRYILSTSGIHTCTRTYVCPKSDIYHTNTGSLKNNKQNLK